jgi:N-acetylneuraminate lyase
MKPHLLTGLVAATYTPFHADGTLDLGPVERYAAHLLASGVSLVFIGGTTGESHSLSPDERRALAERWFAVARGTDLRVIVHVGSNSLDDARALAAHAEKLGAPAISALTPSYFKPRDVETLVACCARIASAAPNTPFYYYDIPPLTNVTLSPPDFLALACERIPTLAGLKFSNPDLMAYQILLNADGGKWDVPWGSDEVLLAALAVGATGAVGSTYNFIAPVYHRLLAAFARGDLATARAEQFRSVQLIRLLARYGYLGASKALMSLLGLDLGPIRLPLTNPTAGQFKTLRAELETLGFFDWIKS